MSNDSGPRSLTRKAGAVIDTCNPFDPVKIELGIALTLGALLWVGLASSAVPHGAQLLVLLAFGCSAALWLVWRIRRVVRRMGRGSQTAEPLNGPQ